jgi:hypothetical protein
LITRRLPPRQSRDGTPPPPVVRPVDQVITYKGYEIEARSYSVGSVSWSPRAVVSLRTVDGAWQRTPLYSTNSARFPTQSEADRQALDVAKAWIDATPGPPPPSGS